MAAFKAWFTPARRKAAYKLGMALGVFLIAIGAITPDSIALTERLLNAFGSALLILTNFLAVINVNPEA